MKVFIYGSKKEEIKPLIRRMGFVLTETKPDFILSYGGDGTIMSAEKSYPGVPKVILKNSLIAKKSSPLGNEEVLRRFKNGQYKIKEFWKLEAEANGKKLLALNDVTIHNQDPRHAIRYRIRVNGNMIEHEIIGDGIVVATPFGSTGYYRSITGSFFEVGLGLAFNNSTEQADHMVLKEESEVKIKIIRGPADIYADNQKEYIGLSDGDEAVVKKSEASAKIVVVDEGP